MPEVYRETLRLANQERVVSRIAKQEKKKKNKGGAAMCSAKSQKWMQEQSILSLLFPMECHVHILPFSTRDLVDLLEP